MVVKIRLAISALLIGVSLACSSVCVRSQVPDAPEPAIAASAGSPAQAADGGQNFTSGAQGAMDGVRTGIISGTVTDTSGGVVSGASVVLEGPETRSSETTSDSGVFTFDKLKAGPSYRLTISGQGFDNWTSPPVSLAPGEIAFVKDIHLKISDAVTSVTVTSSIEQIATEQVALEEKQRVFGFIPNYYVVYDSENAAPMTARLKFQMALKVSVDPVSFLGAAFLAGVDQVSDNPDYRQGARGYAERFGSVYADGLTDTMFGGAILPTILRQDPRYYYKGTGTIRSRTLHAIAAPFICRGDNGRLQPNFSSVGGDLISASISTAYYPKDDRGASLVFENLLIDTAERTASALVQEFLLRKWTPSAKNRN